MPVQPYLFFGGNCEKALDFYREAIGAQVEHLMRYKESPDPLPPSMDGSALAEKIMHASVRIDDGVVMASDGCAEPDSSQKMQGFSLVLHAADVKQAQQRFDALAAGGTVQMPFGKTFFSPGFGMLSDRFGVPWTVIVPTPM